MKPGVEMKPLSLSERMTLLSEYNLYTSRNARRCPNCFDAILRKRPQERTFLSSKQTNDLINDLIAELVRVKNTPFITDDSNAFSKEDYFSWTG